MQAEGVDAWAEKTGERRVDPNADPAHHQQYIDQMSQTSQKVVLETLAYLSAQDPSDILPEIDIPTLILVAATSTSNTPDRTRGMASLLPNSTLVEIPGTSGYVQHSAPDKCATAWRNFISRLSHGWDRTVSHQRSDALTWRTNVARWGLNADSTKTTI